MDDKQIKISLERAEILRETFTDNDDLLKIIRKLFYGFEVTDHEKSQVTTVIKGNEQLKEAIKLKIFALLSPDAPVGSNPDFWIGVEEQIQGQHPDTVKQIIEAKSLCLTRLEDAMTLLENPDAFKVEGIVRFKPVLGDNLGTELIARNLYVKAIENGLSYIKIVCGLSKEDMKKAEEQKKQNTTK